MTMATRHPGSFAVVLAVACASLGVGAQFVHGQMVPGNVRAVDSSAPGQMPDGTTWQTAYRDLQDALDEAFGNQTITEIWVAVGSLDAAGNPLGYVPTRLTLHTTDLPRTGSILQPTAHPPALNERVRSCAVIQ